MTQPPALGYFGIARPRSRVHWEVVGVNRARIGAVSGLLSESSRRAVSPCGYLSDVARFRLRWECQISAI